MTFLESIRAFPKTSENGNPKTPVFDHSNYRFFERIPVVPGSSNNQGLTVFLFLAGVYYVSVRFKCFKTDFLASCICSLTVEKNLDIQLSLL